MSEEETVAADEQLGLYGLMGLAFEDRVEMALASLATEMDWPYNSHRPGEVEAGGIKMSPDIILEPKAGSGETETRELSVKVTWKSARGLPITEEGENEFPSTPAWDYYFGQCMTYAVPLETTGSVLLVYFVNGNYKPPVPVIHAWELDFSSQEKAENWDAVLNAARDVR